MSNSCCLPRVLFCLTLLLITFSQTHASTITWKGIPNTTDWHTPENWIGDIVPSAADSVIITGGNINSLNIVLISADAVALHITIDGYSELGILLSTSLNVSNAPGLSIKIEENGSLLNFGSLTVSNSFSGFNILGKFENHEDCTIHSMVSNGIYLHGTSSSKNKGDLFIMDTDLAFLSEEAAQYTNEGFMSLEDGTTGITNSSNTNFENKGRIDITNMERHGILNFETFVNNGPLKLDSIASGFLSVAVFNSSGYFENNSNIVMSNILGTAIINGSTSDLGVFLNSGIILVQDAKVLGLVAEPMSKFTITKNGSLVLKSIGFTPFDILEGGVFEVEDGGFVNIIN